MIALPTHGYGAFRRALLGSVTAKVLHDAQVPVWTSAHVPEPTHRAHPKPRRILAAVDLRNGSAPTLDFALGIARESDASVEILHVAPPGEPGPVDHGARLHELLTSVSHDREIPIVESKEAEAEIASAPAGIAATIRSLAIRKRIDLVVIGRGCIRSTGPGRFNSHAYSIIREAPCPVLSV